MKKSNLRKIIRESINSIMNEQSGSLGKRITMTPCPDGSGTGSFNQISWEGITVNGNAPVIGDKIDVGASALSNSSITGEWIVTNVVDTGIGCQANPAIVGADGFCDIPTHNLPCGGSTGDNKCTLADFQAAAGPHMATAPAPHDATLMNTWLPMFHGKWVNHPKGCEKFLPKRLAIQQNKLAQLQSAGTNPIWQQMLQAKIAAMQAIIAACCKRDPSGGGGFNG